MNPPMKGWVDRAREKFRDRRRAVRAGEGEYFSGRKAIRSIARGFVAVGRLLTGQPAKAVMDGAVLLDELEKLRTQITDPDEFLVFEALHATKAIKSNRVLGLTGPASLVDRTPAGIAAHLGAGATIENVASALVRLSEKGIVDRDINGWYITF